MYLVGVATIYDTDTSSQKHTMLNSPPRFIEGNGTCYQALHNRTPTVHEAFLQILHMAPVICIAFCCKKP